MKNCICTKPAFVAPKARPAPSLLVHIETSLDIGGATSYQTFRIKHDLDAWTAARVLYGWLGEEDGPPYLERLESCRSYAWFTRHERTGRVRIVTTTCKLRWCPLCQSARRNWVSAQVSEWLAAHRMAKFVTVTLKNSDCELAEQIAYLRKCFVKLRSSSLFRRKCRGGVWFLQVKKGKRSKQWHPHMHCLIDSEFIDRRTLSGLWEKITKDSMVTDIRLVVDKDKAANEVARYCAGSARLAEHSAPEAIEIFYALHGRRIAGTWGTGRKIKLRPPKFEDRNSWKTVGGWKEVTGAGPAHATARMILDAWKNNTPLAAGVSMVPTPKSMKDLDAEFYRRPGVQPFLDFYHPS